MLPHMLGMMAFELALFAAVIFVLFSVDDIALDVLAYVRPWRGAGREDAGLGDAEPGTLAATAPPQSFAVFVPAWREHRVIAAMLTHMLDAWAGQDFRVYVGVYPNDAETLFAAGDVAARDARVRIVINHDAGPTTKGACLNRLWQALVQDRAQDQTGGAWAATAVLLHDAEDWVDPLELTALSRALADADYAQLRVIPINGRGSRWIGGHYCDEFAEAHGRDMPVRAALGAPMPTAGVGCAFRVDALAALSPVGAAGPFAAGSLTEDYELGIRLSANGARARFVAVSDGDGRLVGTRALFPADLGGAVRQKARWMRGIALDGWENLGWVGTEPSRPMASRIAALWMLWRDRRALIAALATFAGYAALLLMFAAIATGHAGDGAAQPLWIDRGGAASRFLFGLCAVLMVWRLVMRGVYTARVYGWAQGVLAPLRQPISSIIHVMIAWRAVLAHIAGRNGRALVWDKTEHDFPDAAALAALPVHRARPSRRSRGG